MGTRGEEIKGEGKTCAVTCNLIIDIMFVDPTREVVSFLRIKLGKILVPIIRQINGIQIGFH